MRKPVLAVLDGDLTVDQGLATMRADQAMLAERGDRTRRAGEYAQVPPPGKAA